MAGRCGRPPRQTCILLVQSIARPPELRPRGQPQGNHVRVSDTRTHTPHHTPDTTHRYRLIHVRRHNTLTHKEHTGTDKSQQHAEACDSVNTPTPPRSAGPHTFTATLTVPTPFAPTLTAALFRVTHSLRCTVALPSDPKYRSQFTVPVQIYPGVEPPKVLLRLTRSRSQSLLSYLLSQSLKRQRRPQRRPQATPQQRPPRRPPPRRRRRASHPPKRRQR